MNTQAWQRGSTGFSGPIQSTGFLLYCPYGLTVSNVFIALQSHLVNIVELQLKYPDNIITCKFQVITHT